MVGMKKRWLYFIALWLLAGSALAGVDVAWQASGGFYFSADPDTGILAEGGTTFAQLIYTPSGTISPATPGGGVSGDNVVWQQIEVDTEWADFNAVNFTNNFVSGSVFARIFEKDPAEVGDWYYDSALLELQDISDPTPPQKLEMNRDLDGDAIDGEFGAQIQGDAPEPFAITDLGLSSNNGEMVISLSFDSEGFSYILQRSTNLVDGAWIDVRTNSASPLIYTNDVPAAFFRIRAE